MGLRLTLYLGILALGGIIGYNDKVSERLQANLNKIQNLCLLFLLFIMGITIGINDRVISNLISIGFKAGIISFFTVLFSIIFVGFIKKTIVLEGEDIES
ncbi:LysO family transporter [Tissierella praeacuta]|uniref:LysO family transporter n=1 Tax=Tissierella praeacuta TaxID=43131 RepID=UPI0028B173C9|nr:LysO family transporter [Tissierella praeacuta]